MMTQEGKPVRERPVEMVRLKNGTEEAKPLVVVTMASLNGLFVEGKALVVYDLVCLCRDPGYKPFGDAGEVLWKSGLVERDGDRLRVHESIRNIVLSAAAGEGLDMSIGSPLAK